MNKVTTHFLLLLFVFAKLISGISSQTYSYTYVRNSIDTLAGVDSLTEKEMMVLSIASHIEENFTKDLNYGSLYYENDQSGFGKLVTCKSSYLLFDYQQQLIWKSSDSNFYRIEYVLPSTYKVLSSNLIQYDLEPGIYIIVDKDLPIAVCPNIFISGLKYGVRKFVSNNDVIELKNYEVNRSTPSFLQEAADKFKQYSSSVVTNVFPAYLKNRKKRVGRGANGKIEFK